MDGTVSLAGGTVLWPDGTLSRGDVHVADGRIVGTAAADAARIDCTGLHVLPGIVDVHGDAFELELFPRPGVDMPFDIAMGSVDRQLAANGITTAFHGLTVSWEPGARSLDAARRFMDGLARLRPRLTADHRVQLRWETYAHEVIGDIAGWLATEPVPALAFNDHTTGTIALAEAGEHAKFHKWAQRAGVSLKEYMARIGGIGARAAEVPARIAEVAALGRRHGAVMLSHDARSEAELAEFRALGATVCEFPLSRGAAAAAAAAGEPVVMGGPNVIRGGSHTGAIPAEDAVRDGLCTVLASDYYYPSLLHAAERLVARGVLGLGDAWALVSANPAAAMGLGDRGALAPGRRADMVVLDTDGPWRIVRTVAGGTVLRPGR